ncbi:MAG: DUF1292 domain-containing protein [Eubacterium sp.]|nr:DUF1292 domain-containing protein [Eubacterium sp.]
MEQGMITLTDEDGSEIEFYILEQTELGGSTYLLVTDSDEEAEEAEALILRETVESENGHVVYETVEDETTLKALSGLFEELLEEIDIRME